MELLPGGGGLVVPTYNGINLQPVINNNKTIQSLPGNRELGAFCAASGRALLIRHWPDYRRSIELILPGIAPRQLWLGEEAVLGVACDSKGERIWAVIGTWTGEWAQHTILLMDSEGNELSRRLLTPWRMKGGNTTSIGSCWHAITTHREQEGAELSQSSLSRCRHPSVANNYSRSTWKKPNY
jgi:hypothetical protein